MRGPLDRSSSDAATAEAAGFLTIGRHTYGSPSVHLYEGDLHGVAIGSFCSIGEDVELLPGGFHDAGRLTTFPLERVTGEVREPTVAPVGPAPTRGIVVGSDVWVGRGARILSEVTIGHGAVVGAYAVVARDVRPYAVVVGSPAQEVRRRFSDDEVATLLDLAWWEWPDEAIVEHRAALTSGSVARLQAAAESMGREPSG